jgi:hypothetical protein
MDPQLGIHKLCIDHVDVRETLVKDEQGYNVRTVPCIFLFYPNGRLEKYEGSDAFTWLRKIKEILYQPSVSQQPPPPPPQQTPIQQLKTIPRSEQQQQFEPPPPMEHDFEPPQQPLDITPIEENGIQGGREDLEDIMNKEMELRRASDQVITRKQENIKELAQMMQRQRESDDDKIAPPALYPKEQGNRY